MKDERCVSETQNFDHQYILIYLHLFGIIFQKQQSNEAQPKPQKIPEKPLSVSAIT